jgi:cation:H+ antiporter
VGGVWLEFGVAVALIGIGGSQLSRFGDEIADHSRLGETLVGVFLLALVTSLPELVIGVSSVVLAGAADLAVGAIFGSCVFNLVILVLLDVALRGETVYSHVSRDHVLAAAFGVVLIGTAGFGVALGSGGPGPALGHVGLVTPVVALVYAIAARALARHQARHGAPPPFGPPPARRVWRARAGFAAAAVVVVAAGVWLPFVGERIAAALGVRDTFVGTLFLAFATSLPELVVTLAALRLGAFDMAVGNLLGSNLVNVLILVPEDLLYRDGPILGAVSPLHAVSGMSALVMTGVAIVGLVYRPRRRFALGLSWASMSLLSIYLLNTYVLYLYDR